MKNAAAQKRPVRVACRVERDKPQSRTSPGGSWLDSVRPAVIFQPRRLRTCSPFTNKEHGTRLATTPDGAPAHSQFGNVPPNRADPRSQRSSGGGVAATRGTARWAGRLRREGRGSPSRGGPSRHCCCPAPSPTGGWAGTGSCVPSAPATMRASDGTIRGQGQRHADELFAACPCLGDEDEHDPEQPADEGNYHCDEGSNFELACAGRALTYGWLVGRDDFLGRAEPALGRCAPRPRLCASSSRRAVSMCSRISATSPTRRDRWRWVAAASRRCRYSSTRWSVSIVIIAFPSVENCVHGVAEAGPIRS